ncbi:MAG: TonB-dependent receptor [Gammaproteobacteria bacterium]|nr:MAG: TonB-dependent receptor [Gammaproteobacteria bacterium]
MIEKSREKSYLATAIHAIVCSGVLMAVSPLVHAEAPADAVGAEEIVVTGSRIKRPELSSNSPISVIDSQALKLANTTNPEEFLRSDPRFVAAIGSNTNNGNDGASTVDLRNLGEERTLVLVDGKRFTPYDYQGFVDLSMIPTALLERVEVITGGASAVYGSDAVGGVVNFIMKKNFEGVEFDYSRSSTFENDGKGSDMSLTFGGNINDGRGNIVASMSYSKKAAVYQGARKFSEFQLDNLLEEGGSTTHPNGTIYTSENVPAFGVGVDDPLQFDDNGKLTSDVKSFNFNPYNLFQTPQEKYTATVLANYKITDEVEFFSRISFANNRVDTVIAPTGTFFYNYQLNTDNPYLSAEDQAVLAGLDAIEPGAAQNDGLVDIQFGRRLTELGNRESKYQNTTMQFEAGLRGNFGNNIDWEIFVEDGRTSRTQNFLNDASLSATQQAMLAVTDPDTGEIVCQDPSGGCVPVDYYGPGKITDEMANFIRLNLNETNETTQTIYGGSVSGDTPLTIPFASHAIGFAVGAEYREEAAENHPDQNYATGNTIGYGASSPVNASIKVTEYFAETRIPIIENAAFAKAITLEAAVRGSDYTNTVSNAGKVTNDFNSTSYKFGGEWAINNEFRLRSLFQHAVRAPNMREIGLPKTSSIGDLSDDYCSDPEAASDPTLVATCQGTGVPVGKVGAFNSIIAGQVNNYIGGNTALTPEKADTVTFGFIYNSSAIPLSLSVDYYDIEIKNAIVQLSEQSIVDACYLNEKDASGTFCSLIHRNPITGSLNGGTETGVDASVINAGRVQTKGVDVTASYNLDLEKYGALSFQLDVVNTIESVKKDAPALDEYDCVGLVGKTCTRPDPKVRFIQSTTWAKGPMTLKLSWQHIGELKQDALVLGSATTEDYAAPVISAYDYFNLYASYELMENITLRAGITNLLDKKPPIVGNEYGGTAENSGNTYPATYDTLGRSGFLGVNMHF